MYQLVLIIRQYIILIVLGVVFCVTMSQFTACDTPYPQPAIDYARIGHVAVYKNATKYKVRYQSELDLVVSEGEADSTFNLGLIKNIVNAGIDKRFVQLYVQRGCFSKLKSAYSKIGIDTKTSHYIYEQPIMDCPIYGNSKIAAIAIDKDLYDSTMLEITESWKALDWHQDRSEYEFVPFITRGEDGR